jgi:hypothetical protein
MQVSWQNNVSGVYVVQVSLFLIGQQGWDISALASHWLEDCANCMPTPEKNDKYSATTVSAVRAASQSTFINTPLVISGNDKNKQLLRNNTTTLKLANIFGSAQHSG